MGNVCGVVRICGISYGVSTDRCCVRLSVRLLPWWILGRRVADDGVLESSQGMKEGQLGGRRPGPDQSTGRRGPTFC